MKIGFIGGGNMGGALIGGLMSSCCAPEDITLFEKNTARADEFKEKGVNTVLSAAEVEAASEIIVFSVKPNVIDSVLSEMKGFNDKIYLSIAAGVTVAHLEEMLGADKKIVRAMPNTPAQVGCGMTVITPNKNLTDEETAEVEKILSGVGATEVMPEKFMSVATALHGSSPAYVYMFIDAMADAGVSYGLTKAQALKHPNWNMGQKITTDSATLMNKGLELIEAVWLFGVTSEKVEVNVHRQSILHSAVEFEDGSVIGQMGVPDMRIPIQFALTYPERLPSPAKRLSLFDVGTMTFEKADEETFLCLKYAKKMIAKGGTACTVLNSANEAAVGLFLEDKIPFYRIGELVADACENVREHKEVTLGNILDSENTAREYVITHV